VIPIDRSRLPAVGPDPRFVFPVVETATLRNGLRVWTAERRGLPVLTMLLLIPIGSSADPADRPGLAAMTADMLDEGSGDRSALDVEDAFARIGSDLSTEIGPDATVLALTTLSRFAGRALDLLADVVIRPRLDGADFARVRDLRINRVVQHRDVPSIVAERTFARLVYPGHPYGHLATGTERALRTMALDEVVEFHGRRFIPPRATLIMVGDARHDELVRLAEDAFGAWGGSAGTPVPGTGRDPADGGAARVDDDLSPSDPAPPDVRLAVVHRPDATQSELRVGHLAAARHTPDYHALLVLNAILGGQFVSRLNMNLREEKGFTYGVRSSFDFRRGRGPFVVQLAVATSATADAVRESLSEIVAIRGPRPATARELDVARASLTRGYPRSFETVEQIARAVLQTGLYDLSADHFERFVPSITRIGTGDVSAAAHAHLAPEQAVVAVVGDHARVASSLSQLGLGEPVLMGTTEE
jgi:zinc protease